MRQQTRPSCGQAVSRLLVGTGRWEIRTAGPDSKGQRCPPRRCRLRAPGKRGRGLAGAVDHLPSPSVGGEVFAACSQVVGSAMERMTGI
jgi:hypothetical protein